LAIPDLPHGWGIRELCRVRCGLRFGIWGAVVGARFRSILRGGVVSTLGTRRPFRARRGRRFDRLGVEQCVERAGLVVPASARKRLGAQRPRHDRIRRNWLQGDTSKDAQRREEVCKRRASTVPRE
jgi:hypothetical protein